MIFRSLFALLLCVLIAAVATSQTPAKDNESPSGPKEIAGKNLQEWVKMTSNPDPAVREQAVAVLANFATDIKKDKEIAKYLLNRLDKQETDSTVRTALVDLIGALELEAPDDPKEVPRILAKMAVDQVSALRLHSLEALGRFGPKAYGVIMALNVDRLMHDQSYQIRVAVAQVLGSIGRNEAGPSPVALSMLSLTLSKDISAPVRLSALQSLFALGPPLKNGQPDFSSELAKKVVAEMKGRIGAIKGATASENDKQIELWYRLVIIKFGGDLDEQLNAIAQHVADKEIAVRLQAVEVLGLVGEKAAPKIDVVVGMLNEKEPVLRVAALKTLGAIGVKAIDPILRVINDAKEEPEMRIAALAALSIMGEKAEDTREMLTNIIKAPENLEEPTASRIALLHQALLTLASMGVKAQSEIPMLSELAGKLDGVKQKRLNSPEHKKLIRNPEYVRLMERLTEKQKKELMDNQPEDQFKKFVLEAIKFIEASTPGHPGGEKKAP